MEGSRKSHGCGCRWGDVMSASSGWCVLGDVTSAAQGCLETTNHVVPNKVGAGEVAFSQNPRNVVAIESHD